MIIKRDYRVEPAKKCGGKVSKFAHLISAFPWQNVFEDQNSKFVHIVKKLVGSP